MYKYNEKIRNILDIGVEDDLKGLDLDKKIVTLRLDAIIENGEPRVIEIEEAYSGIGITHALGMAYGVDCSAFYESISKMNINYILADDQWSDYMPELTMLQRRLRNQTGIETILKFLVVV